MRVALAAAPGARLKLLGRLAFQPLGRLALRLKLLPAGSQVLCPGVMLTIGSLWAQMGALPLNFEIEASSLSDAIAKYGPAVKTAFDRAMQEIQEMRRQASSSIVLPGAGGAGSFGPGGIPGGLPGGGKLKLP